MNTKVKTRATVITAVYVEEEPPLPPLFATSVRITGDSVVVERVVAGHIGSVKEATAATHAASRVSRF